MHKAQKGYRTVTFAANQYIVVFDFIALNRKSDFLVNFPEIAETLFIIL